MTSKTQQHIIKGIPVSAGVVTGIARVITSLDEIKRFTPGEILVTVATSPAWTPLIHAASAVVTDVGGALSHAAIVCREYGKPAVVGTRNGTKKIKDERSVTVDGEKGTVIISGKGPSL